MSRAFGLSRPRLLASVIAATAVSAAVAVSLSTGAAGHTARVPSASAPQSARTTDAQTGEAANLPTTQLVSHTSSNSSASLRSAARKTVTCTAKNTKITITKVSRPYNHLLLRATNTGKDNCNAYYAPALGLGAEPQAATWVIEETKPQAVVTLFPGESAYASIIISGINQREDNYVARTALVSFQGRNNDGSVGPNATLKLPGKGVINADDAMVTYWQDSKKAALSW